ncbi:MAG: hypothetical protein JJT96_20390 [Opitutales bacterium]|nr:hypothetical protein [Opitutales bacterium]
MKDIETWMNSAEEAARAAGDCLRAGSAELRQIHFRDRADVKLRADLESEALIRSLLAKATPFPVIGEEQGGDASLTERNELYWVVDPLDGTYNYLRDSPHCCVSIGLLRGETPVGGVIYDFNANTCFRGCVTAGLEIDGRAVQPQWAESLDQAVLQTGFPAAMSKSSAALEDFIRHVQRFKKVRMIGSAALALAYVASGRADVYFEASIRWWDVAAGLALVQAAGGVVRMKPSPSGQPLTYDVWAAGRNAFLEPRAANE